MATKGASKGAKPPDRKPSRPKKDARGPRRGSAAVDSVVRRHRTHRTDIWGLAVIVVGLLVAGSVWFSAAGPVGEQVDRALAAGFGLVRMALPVGLAAMGVAALLGGRRGGATVRARGAGDGAEAAPGTPAPTVERPDSVAAMMLGGGLLLVSATGLLHLARGRPGLGDGLDEFGAAGGALGVGVGGFLHAWTALWGSVLVLVFVGLVGVIFVTGLTVRSVTDALVAGLRQARRVLRPVGRALWSAVVKLFSDIPEAPPSPRPAGAGDNGRPDAAPAGADASSRAAAGPEAAPARLEPSFAELAPPEPKTRGSATARKRRRDPSKWSLPSVEMLGATPSREIDMAEVAERGQLLQATLKRFDVPTVLLEPVVGPTVTRFVLELGEGVRVSKLESLRKDIALAMASPDIRILSPIPGRRAIGVEVPNLDRQIVRLGDVLRSPEAAGAGHPLEVAVGRDINGHAIMMNLATTPHLLIAGATGAGKSSCLNSLITSVLMRTTPDDVRMILVDPKRVEMGQYDGVPHLLTPPVTDPRKAANALSWAVREMERRYDVLSGTGFRDIAGYNAAVEAGSIKPPARVPGADSGPQSDQTGEGVAVLGGLVPGSDGEPPTYASMPFALVVVDELADLMMVAARDVEESIARIAQMARAVGIHLVIATQRPSVNIITGVIKANIPARLAFAVSSLTDSRVILDQPGAERLVGQGDMLWLGPSSSTPHRIQGCWVTEDEVRAVVGHWVDQAPDSQDDPSVTAEGQGGREPAGPAGRESAGPDLGGDPIMPASITDAPPPPESDDGDELLDAAMALVVETQLGSTSMLQRRLRVGFARAGRIMDLLEQRGVVGPSTGSKAREVLITPEEFEGRRAG